MAVNREKTKVSMSLSDYERLKECQKGYIDLVMEIKSMLKSTNISEHLLEITIDKEKLENFLLDLAADDLPKEHLDCTEVFFSYK